MCRYLPNFSLEKFPEKNLAFLNEKEMVRLEKNFKLQKSLKTEIGSFILSRIRKRQLSSYSFWK